MSPGIELFSRRWPYLSKLIFLVEKIINLYFLKIQVVNYWKSLERRSNCGRNAPSTFAEWEIAA